MLKKKRLSLRPLLKHKINKLAGTLNFNSALLQKGSALLL